VGEASTRERRWEERFAVPVLVAALASVPAVFLTLLDGGLETVGNVVNWASGAVLVAETVVLFAVSDRKGSWLREHVWLVLLTVAVVVAVVLAIGPVQLLRLLRVFGALRIVRAGRIVKAARILRRRAGLTGWWTRVAAVGAGVLVAAFVAVVLADPTSRTRQLLEQWVGDVDGLVLVVLALLAGALLAGATYVVMRQRQAERREH
jgi:hypothetical protein